MNRNSKSYKIVVITGEVSGDIHGAKLISEIKNIEPRIELSGIGGELMIKEGFAALVHIKQMAFLGFGEILKHLPFIRHVFKIVLEHIRTTKPDAVILIDYPGFNLRIARSAKKMKIPVIYYISPQLWAWGTHRVKKIKHFVDKMLVIFPFEVNFYKQHGIESEYVGHPLVDSHYNSISLETKEISETKTLGLLPGSRQQEVEYLLPDMLNTALVLKDKGKIDRALIAYSDTIPLELYQKYIKDFDFVTIYQSSIDKFYHQLDVALVSSGTATLETAYFQVPMIIVYRVNNFTWYLGRLLVKLKDVGLANIVAEEKVAHELLQKQFVPIRAAQLLEQLLQPDRNEKVREQLKIIRKKLGPPGASRRGAESIIDYIYCND